MDQADAKASLSASLIAAGCFCGSFDNRTIGIAIGSQSCYLPKKASMSGNHCEVSYYKATEVDAQHMGLEGRSQYIVCKRQLV